ncbi:uncharacterized protein PV07_06787 [Cladophialophora immunda]|uniref:Glycoside hydrolase family 43 protein n=1 Tax=Cladophialophora immunda TaxID=569365 RepID=A0A0D2C990_9EURO|nr:uncharacterized protein PV07_06787 [Cladophialophora immunda]KIW27005.1 hypothetical protein PV07_06787 [Cladophialophora immunda]
MATQYRIPEKEPLLAAHSRRPHQGGEPASHIHSEKQSILSTFPPSPSSDLRCEIKDNHFFSLSLQTQILLGIMVAIPTYLLASTAVSSLGPLTPRGTVIRSPDPLPQSSSSTLLSSPDSSPFASILGPHISSNFPDPAVIYVDGVSYAFATNNRALGPDLVHVQVATSTDNQTWTLLDHHDALPTLGAWETGAGVWAPDVVQLDDGSFVLYYADNVAWSPAHHCVGAATSQNVLGPYVPLDTPFACPDVNALGGAIDPDGFLDESTNKRYVVYKVDGNSIGHGGSCGNTVAPIVPTPLMLQEVGPDGITLVGDAVEILDRDEFDGPLIEAPSLHRSDEGIYFLFFSSNCFTTPKYDVSYATATNVWGPYTKSSRPLLVTSDADLTGPGGMDIVKGGNLILFHGHMTINNDPTIKKEAESLAASTNTTINNVNLPLVRGMWSGTATFQGTNVLLS